MSERGRTSSCRRLCEALLGVTTLAALGGLSLLSPEGVSFFSCPFKGLTGLSCLTCGLTRSLLFALQGELVASFHYHLMGPLLLAGTLLVVGVWLWEAATGNNLRFVRSTAIQRYATKAFALTWLAFAAVRLMTEIGR